MSSEAEQGPIPENSLPPAESAVNVRSAVSEFATDDVGLDFLGDFAESWPIVGLPIVIVVGAWRILRGQPEKSPWRAWLRRRRARTNATAASGTDSAETP